jgi:hypothetical protein
MTETAKITRRPALTQSLKGIITTGPLKSLWYSSAKFSKWSAGRQQAPASAAAPPSDPGSKPASEGQSSTTTGTSEQGRIDPRGKE